MKPIHLLLAATMFVANVAYAKDEPSNAADTTKATKTAQQKHPAGKAKKTKPEASAAKKNNAKNENDDDFSDINETRVIMVR